MTYHCIGTCPDCGIDTMTYSSRIFTNHDVMYCRKCAVEFKVEVEE
jgi:hypothetical protein